MKHPERFYDVNVAGTLALFDAMEAFGRDITDAICNGLLIPALQRINPAVDPRSESIHCQA